MKHKCVECGLRHRKAAEVYIGMWVCILCWLKFEYAAFYTPDQREALWS